MKQFWSAPALTIFCVTLAGCVAAQPKIPRDQARREVEATERAFARTMADRDHAAFTNFLADEAVFFGGK